MLGCGWLFRGMKMNDDADDEMSETRRKFYERMEENPIPEPYLSPAERAANETDCAWADEDDPTVTGHYG